MGCTDVKELALRVVNAEIACGVSPRSAWTNYSRIAPVLKTHALSGCCEFNREIVSDYVAENERKLERGDITLKHYLGAKLAAQRFVEMHDTGHIEWSAPQKRSRFQINEYYETILADCISAGNFSSKGTSDITWVCRKYFAWLLQEGHEDLGNVGADEVQRFIIYCSHHQKGTGLYNVMLYMKKLYCYLSAKGYSASTHEGLFAFSVLRESRVFPALPPSEIAAIIELMDRRTPKGKRDYAIMLLGVVLGLRAIDIARLSLTDIDWEKGEIKIVQAKTNKSLALPLTNDTGAALKDYILNGRQETESTTVFLRNRAPFQGFSNGVAIGDIYDYYRQRAGLARDAYDGKGFHAVRRSFGKNLVTSGVPVTMVAQLFGDDNIDSVKPYIALDVEHLKECALDFAGVAVKGGAYRE